MTKEELRKKLAECFVGELRLDGNIFAVDSEEDIISMLPIDDDGDVVIKDWQIYTCEEYNSVWEPVYNDDIDEDEDEKMTCYVIELSDDFYFDKEKHVFKPKEAYRVTTTNTREQVKEVFETANWKRAREFFKKETERLKGLMNEEKTVEVNNAKTWENEENKDFVYYCEFVEIRYDDDGEEENEDFINDSGYFYIGK